MTTLKFHSEIQLNGTQLVDKLSGACYSLSPESVLVAQALCAYEGSDDSALARILLTSGAPSSACASYDARRLVGDFDKLGLLRTTEGLLPSIPDVLRYPIAVILVVSSDLRRWFVFGPLGVRRDSARFASILKLTLLSQLPLLFLLTLSTVPFSILPMLAPTSVSQAKWLAIAIVPLLLGFCHVFMIVLHEFGHAKVARSLGRCPIVLQRGISLSITFRHSSHCWRDIMIALGGPLLAATGAFAIATSIYLLKTYVEFLDLLHVPLIGILMLLSMSHLCGLLPPGGDGRSIARAIRRQRQYTQRNPGTARSLTE